MKTLTVGELITLLSRKNKSLPVYMLIDRKESNYDEENEMYKKVYPIRFVHDEIININDGWECGEEHNILLSVPDEDDENEYEYEH